MKNNIIGIGVAVLVVLICMTGCTQQNNTTPPTNTLTTIINKATQITSMSYKMNFTSNSETISVMTYAIWEKAPYMKINITVNGFSYTVISRPNGTFMYNSITHNWTANTLSLPKNMSTFTNELLTTNLTRVGTETFDGKNATIIAYNKTGIDSTTNIRVWLWNDHGVPLKMMLTDNMAGTITTSTVLYTNYSFTDIPDSTFNLTV